MIKIKSKNILVPFLILLIFSACNYKYDMSEKKIIPEQAENKADYDYRTMEYIIKNTKTWNKDLENKTLKFNMFIEDTLNEIDNKKRYLAKIYNIQYYNFDKDGFNKGSAIKSQNVSQSKSTKNKQDSSTSSNQIKKDVKNIAVKEKVINNTQNSDIAIIENKQETKNNKNINNSSLFPLYDSQIFKEYNF